ncbi:hypothetical protein [Neobacillus niacini]|nr:hypothetical protein [Neobacillus niacini]MDR7001348.1 hypothetical protein [Neobacillus niacini]
MKTAIWALAILYLYFSESLLKFTFIEDFLHRAGGAAHVRR